MKKLIGKRIKHFGLSPDKTVIRFTFDDGGSQYYLCEGDCCSEAWVEHVGLLVNLIGEVVTGVEEVDLGDVAPTRQDRDLLYCIKIKTGSYQPFFIEFRNSSNGYYGGEIIDAEITQEQKDSVVDITKDF